MAYGLWRGSENPSVKRSWSPEGLSTTHALYVKYKSHWMLWDRIRASSMESAEHYFADQYPSHARKVVEDAQADVYARIDGKKRSYHGE